jgi:hypothetical protein
MTTIVTVPVHQLPDTCDYLVVSRDPEEARKYAYLVLSRRSKRTLYSEEQGSPHEKNVNLVITFLGHELGLSPPESTVDYIADYVDKEGVMAAVDSYRLFECYSVHQTLAGAFSAAIEQAELIPDDDLDNNEHSSRVPGHWVFQLPDWP